MFREGAKGYVTKNSTAEELVIAIEEVLKGNTYTCREIKDILLNISMSEEKTEHKVSTLTTREMEIIEYLKAGLSSKEIGDKLFITAKTVEVHRHNLLKKLGVKNSVALIEYANKHGL
jgi:DNA-binding NarL/FixJ family response regulator